MKVKVEYDEMSYVAEVHNGVVQYFQEYCNNGAMVYKVKITEYDYVNRAINSIKSIKI